MNKERKPLRGRPSLPAEKRRESVPARLRKELHERFKALGGADWMEPLLDADVEPATWKVLLALPADELRQRLERMVDDVKESKA
jgi:hypothetical protein